MQKIVKWSQNNKMQFNAQKSKVMLVSRRRKWTGERISIYLNGKTIEQTDEIKYLGILVDNHFHFSKHINHVAEKAIKIVYALSRYAKLNWGLGSQALETIYKGAILPVMAYGALISFSPAMTKETNRRKYKRVQRLINIKIAKAYRTISYEASCTLVGETPIIIKLQEIVSMYTSLSESADTTMDRKIIKREIAAKTKVESMLKWEEEWTNTEKGAITKSFFPTIEERLKQKLQHTPNMTIILTGHGKINSYFYRFKIKESPMCICGKSSQTVEHIIYECEELQEERNALIRKTTLGGTTWPIEESSLVREHLSAISDFVQSIDFEELTQ